MLGGQQQTHEQWEKNIALSFQYLSAEKTGKHYPHSQTCEYVILKQKQLDWRDNSTADRVLASHVASPGSMLGTPYGSSSIPIVIPERTAKSKL